MTIRSERELSNKLYAPNAPRLVHAQNLSVQLAIVHPGSLPDHRHRPLQGRKTVQYKQQLKDRGASVQKPCAWAVLLLLLSIPSALNAESVRTARVGAIPLRLQAVWAPLPDYPLRSFEAGRTGKAVAAILVDTGGCVERVEVLVAPDPEIASAVSSTLRRWHFQPLVITSDEKKEVFRAKGELTFYFEIRGGEPFVVDVAAEHLERMNSTQ